MFESFNNRELATFIWLMIIGGWVYWKDPGILGNVTELIKIVASVGFFLPFASLLLYIAGIVLFLHSIEFWTLSLLKDTVLWFLISATAMVSRVVQSGCTKSPLSSVVSDSFKIIIVLEFLLNAYTFPFVVEMIFVPFTTCVVVFGAYLESRNFVDEAKVFRCVRQVQTGTFLILLVFSILSAVSDLEHFFSPESIVQFTVTPILSMIMLPALFYIRLLNRYEQLFVALEIGGVPKSLRRYASRKIICWAGCMTSRVCFLETAFRSDLRRVKSSEDVDELLRRVSLAYTDRA